MMHIGFDAKRIFQNQTGLGNYSRSLVAGLASSFPDHQYSLFAPNKTPMFNCGAFNNVDVHLPQTFINQRLPGLWRRSRIVKDLADAQLNIFHGLSNELPAGIQNISLKSVITVHDLIFERYPQTYNWEQRYTHRWKMKAACNVASAVIATSNQTKQDLQEFYNISADKIFVCYQSCSPIFETLVSEEVRQRVKIKFRLPDKFFLFVSSITKRKNLLSVCKALVQLKPHLNIPLVVIGNGKSEKENVLKFIHANGLKQQVIFLNDLPAAQSEGFTNSTDFPAIYQQAIALLYPSFFEGFGIPLLEAMWSGLPIISSNSSSLPEVAGDAALYFSPEDIHGLAAQMQLIASNPYLRNMLKEKGFIQAIQFSVANHAATVMNVYKTLL